MISSLATGKTASIAISPNTAYRPWSPISDVNALETDATGTRAGYLRFAAGFGLGTRDAPDDERRRQLRRPDRVRREHARDVAARVDERSSREPAVPDDRLRTRGERALLQRPHDHARRGLDPQRRVRGRPEAEADGHRRPAWRGYPLCAVRALLAVLVAVSLAVPVTALAHENKPVVPDAVAGLKAGSIYVDYDARPSLTELEADQLGRRLDAEGHVFVAVLPAAAADEVKASPDGLAAALGEDVGRDGTYVVSVAGRLGAWSNVVAPSHLRPVVANARGSLEQRLNTVVATLPPPAAEEDSNWTAFGIAAAVIVALSLVLLAAVARRRRLRAAGRSG
jgi:hypothetical protein